MDDPRRQDRGQQLDALAAQLRADSLDRELFLTVLAGKLAAALPRQTLVDWEGGLLKKRRVKSVEVRLGDHRYMVSGSGQAFVASHSHTVRGVTLRTEQLDVDTWIEELCRELAVQAGASAQARAAMERLLQ